METIAAHDYELLAYGTRALENISGLRLIGTARGQASVLFFVIEGVHPHDASTILDQEGVAVRASHHCAQPVIERFGISATTRASLAFYNTSEDIDRLVADIQMVKVNEARFVSIRMTLTAPNCPVAGTLPPEVESKVKGVPCAESSSTWCLTRRGRRT